MSNYLTTEHRLDRIRICLDAPACYTDHLTEECSRLFHRRMRTLIAAVLDRVHHECGALLVAAPLTLDLGEMPLFDFENCFCRRLEHQLLEWLLSYAALTVLPAAATSPTNTQPDTLKQFGHYLNHGYWSTTEHRSDLEALDTWLLRELATQPQHSLPVLAGHCLYLGSLLRLYRSLQPATLTRLCLHLAQLQSITEPVTQGTLRLCALRYFQLHPQCTVPVLRQDERAFVLEGNEQLLMILFGGYDTASPALTARLQALWQQSAVHSILERHLTASAYQWLQSRLDRSLVGAMTSIDDSKNNAARRDNSDSNGSGNNSITRHRAAVLEPISVSNGGITLLWPLLPGLFEQLGLMEKSQFIHCQAQVDAVCWLDELIWADGHYAEWRMPLNKLLCGLPLDASLEWTQPDTHAVEVMQQWLSTLPQRLPAWKHFGISDIRQLYLQRPAWLVPSHGDFTLYIEPQVYDVLLTDWPWPTGMLMLPWLIKPLIIHWSAPPVE